jgi:AcrR family transcriptional regulator
MGNDTARPLRERFREQVREDVKAAALAQLAAGGAEAISINAIARQLGVSGPALYRYFAGRDALLTALVVDAYRDLRDALAARTDATAERPPGERLQQLAHAYRAWALAQPHRYRLLFTAPVPGYDAHAEHLVEVAQSLMAVLVTVLRDLDGGAPTASIGDLDPALQRHEHVFDGAGAPELQRAVVVWCRLHGVVSLELGGNFAAMRLDADALFAHEVRTLLDQPLGTRRTG